MKKFREWVSQKDSTLYENLWGNIPSKSRKPSDGWTTKAAPMQMPGMQPMAPKMMKKMKKK